MAQSALIGAALAGIVVAFLGACAYERHFVPEMPKARYELRAWPKGTVVVAVTDARTKKTDDSDRLVRMLTALTNEALATAQGRPTAPRTLEVAILEHEVALKVVGLFGRWHSVTRFRAALLEDQQLLATWNVYGEDWRLNALPAYIDAEQGSQDAFERAIADLMAKLGAGPVP